MGAQSFQLEGSPSSYVATAIATTEQSLSTNALAAGEWFENSSQEPKVVLGNGYLRALGIDDPKSVIGKQLTFTTVTGYRGVGADIPSWSADKPTRSAFDQSKTTLPATIVGVTAPSASDNRLFVPMEWGELVGSPRTSTPAGETSINNIEKMATQTLSSKLLRKTQSRQSQVKSTSLVLAQLPTKSRSNKSISSHL